MDKSIPSWFLKSWTSPRHVKIMGFTLNPLSLHHLVHLEEIDSPILSLRPETTFKDLEMACLICSTTSQDDLRQLIDSHNDPSNRNSKRWRKEINKCMEKDKTFFPRQALLFADYIRSYQTFGQTLESLERSSKRRTDTVTIPWMLNYIVKIAMNTSFSEPEIMDMPISKVVGISHAIDYRLSGETSLLSDADVISVRLAKGELKFEDVLAGKH